MTDERIKRINELAQKSREIGLSPEEEEERAKLRKEYVAAFRESLRSTLDNTYIVDEEGNKKRLSSKGSENKGEK